jgi:hypothetical protein
MKKSSSGQIRHRYNIFTDVCEVCGVIKKKVPYVGDSYNPTHINKYERLYSSDGGLTFNKEYINCIKK